MELFPLEISQDWLTPIGVVLFLLSFYWFEFALTLVRAPMYTPVRLCTAPDQPCIAT